MITIPHTRDQSEALLEYLKTIEGKDLNKEQQNTLLTVFQQTEYTGLRDLIGITLLPLLVFFTNSLAMEGKTMFV